MAKWYYQHRNEEIGPVTEQELLKAFVSLDINADTMVFTDKTGVWEKAGNLKGLEEAVKRLRVQEAQKQERRKRLEEEEVAREMQRELDKEHKLQSLPLSTCGPFENDHYDIIDTVFAFDSHHEGLFNGADPNIAFAGVKARLRAIAVALDADAVIGCSFEYRVAVGVHGGKSAVNGLAELAGVDINLSTQTQVFEIFAYGTAVKLKTTDTAQSNN